MPQGVLQDILNILGQPYIALIILIALAFDFVNGFHDAANSIATVVSTRVLRPFPAVLWAAWWNFAAAWFFGVHVANTVAKWVDVSYVIPEVIFAGLLGAIIWDLITWRFGLPTSSSHALLGGFAGAAVVFAGKYHGVVNEARLWQTVKFIVIAPMIGLALGFLFILAVLWICRRQTPAKVDKQFRVIQLVTAAAYSLGHGTNDAQKTMGIIAALLYASVWQSQKAAFASGKVAFPFWIVLICHLAIALGTMAGGWRIVKTMGMRITKLRPYSGACAESAAAISLFGTAAMGIPVSTTHTITGAIVGVGSVQRLSAVRWGVAGKLVWAWILTIPMSALIAAVSFLVIHFVHPTEMSAKKAAADPVTEISPRPSAQIIQSMPICEEPGGELTTRVSTVPESVSVADEEGSCSATGTCPTGSTARPSQPSETENQVLCPHAKCFDCIPKYLPKTPSVPA